MTGNPTFRIVSWSRILAVILTVGAAPPDARALTFDEAVADLANEDFQTREKAEKFLCGLPMEDIARLEGLARSENPEVAFRASRALFHVRLGMTAAIAPELAAKLADLRNLRPRAATAAVQQLMALEPPPLLTLAGLHSDILANRKRYSRLADNFLAELAKSVVNAAASTTTGIPMEKVHSEIYQDETLALLAEGYGKLQAGHLDSILPVYARWVDQRKQLIPLLAGSAIQLEIARLESTANGPRESIPKLLACARVFPDRSPQRKTILERMTRLLGDDPGFSVDSLDREQGLTYFAALEANWDPAMDIEPYRKFRARFPQPHPDPDTSTLEAIYLLDKEGFNAALALALRQPNDRAAVWLGAWAQTHPADLPKPAVIPPLRKDERRHVHLTGFFNALVPLRGLPEMEADPKAMAAFQALAASNEEWLATAVQSNVGRLAYFVWIRNGTLDAAIPKHLTGSTDRLRELGRLLVTKPETLDLLDPAHQLAADLERILLGMLEGSPLAPETAKGVFGHMDKWKETHADLCKTDSFRFDIPRLESLAPTRNEGLHGLLKLAAGHEEETPIKSTALRAIRRYQAEAPDFPVPQLTAEEGQLFFRTFGNKADAAQVFGDSYLEFRRRFPAPDPAAEPCQLETLACLDAGQIDAAFAVARQQQSSTAAQWVGEWINKHPETLTNPLFVLVNRGNGHQAHCDALLHAMAPYQTLAEFDANPKVTAAFDVLAESPVWIQSALKGDNYRLGFHHYIRANQLDQLLSTHLKGESRLLRRLGNLLAENPALLASIKPESQQAPDLGALVEGLAAARSSKEQQDAISASVATWRKVHPGLPEKVAFSAE